MVAQNKMRNSGETVQVIMAFSSLKKLRYQGKNFRAIWAGLLRYCDLLYNQHSIKNGVIMRN